LSDKPVIELISELTEFNDMKAFMNDPDLDYALDLIIKLIAKPDVPATKAPDLIVKMQALSSKFAMMSRFYTTFEKGGENSKKKNVYYTAEEAISKLVDALKYSAKYGA
jgi:hypothetical protein